MNEKENLLENEELEEENLEEEEEDQEEGEEDEKDLKIKTLEKKVEKQKKKLNKGRDKYLETKKNINEIIDQKVGLLKEEEKLIRLHPWVEERLEEIKQLQEDKKFDSLSDAYVFWVGKQATDPSQDGIAQSQNTAINGSFRATPTTSEADKIFSQGPSISQKR